MLVQIPMICSSVYRLSLMSRHSVQSTKGLENQLAELFRGRSDHKAGAGGFDDCSGDDMEVIYVENSLDLSE